MNPRKLDLNNLFQQLMECVSTEISSQLIFEVQQKISGQCLQCPKQDKLLVDTNELCRLLSISKSTIINLRKHGMPFIKIGNSVRFDVEKVIEHLNNHHNTE